MSEPKVDPPAGSQRKGTRKFSIHSVHTADTGASSEWGHSLHLVKKRRAPGAPRTKPIFFGLALKCEEEGVRYSLVVHDGTGVVGLEQDVCTLAHEEVMDYIVSRAKAYCENRGNKLEIFSIAGPVDPSLKIDHIFSKIWIELDALPFLLPKSQTPQFSLETAAGGAITRAISELHPLTSSMVKISLSSERKVLPDCAGLVKLFVLDDVKKITSPQLWDNILVTSKVLKERKRKIAFFSATPQGGGVALMRHALIRVWQMLGVDVSWYVAMGDSHVFDITKRKFHNVLQNVCPPDTQLYPEEMELHTKWTEWNHDEFWAKLPAADLVVIDDPQLTALIPLLKRDSPNTKIIYRSHIQIESHLVDKPGTAQNGVWDYLFGFIKSTDLFVAHPVKAFVPKVVQDEMTVVYMPPSTDPLDGLNKPLVDMGPYRYALDQTAMQAFGRTIDWKRPYILQIARFDPSKGIPHLVEGYKLFRAKYKRFQKPDEKPPFLLLTGHSSVDDPDASLIIHQLQEQMSDPSFKEIYDDIYPVRAPPSDVILNAAMRGARIVCQVSTKEGFEIKVTEALHAGKPLVVTRAGGIPLQVREGRDGMIIPPADPSAISNALLELYMKPVEAHSLKLNETLTPTGGRWTPDGDGPEEKLFTTGNMMMWHLLWLKVLGIEESDLKNLDAKEKAILKAMGFDGKKHEVKEMNELTVWEDFVAKGLEAAQGK
ncbi:glycosyltransferase family 4 protein [Atractiella rhizophila]|nr:glycosyltransferase family 4 protein [Atractiella rhizophila]